MSRMRLYGLLLIVVIALLVCPVAVPPIVAAPSVQSGDLTILFNADTRPSVPIWQANPYPHEGIHMTCSLLGSESSVYLQLTVDGIMTSQEQCDGTIEAHGLAGHSVDISAQDILGVGPVFHLIAYGTDPSATPTPTPGGPTATPTDYPLGCSPFGVSGRHTSEGYSWSLAYVSRHVWPYDTGSGSTLPYAPLNADEIVIQLENVNTNNGGFSSYIMSDNSGANALTWHLIPGNPSVNLLVNGVNQTTRILHFPTGGGDTSVYEADVCIWLVNFVGTPTPTPTPTITATPTAVVTGTPLPTPLPSYGTCVLVNASLNSGVYAISVFSDMYLRHWRIQTGNLPVTFSASSPDGSFLFDINDRDWKRLTLHTSFSIWTSTTPFSVSLCTPIPVIPTLTATVNPFSTLTPTRTATATPTGTITPSVTGSPTNTGTPLPTSTPPGTCATPDSEDSAECAILELLKTPPVIETPVPVSTPVPNISTAVAIICERDPCASAGDVTETIGDIIVILEESSHAPNCMDFQWPSGIGGGTYFQLPEQDFAVGLCAFLDMSATLRAWMRVLSVFFFAMIGVKYYLMTMRRVGDV